MTSTPTASPPMKYIPPWGLRSSFSNSVSGLCAPPNLSSLMFGLQHLLRVDVVGRQQRNRTQVVAEVRNPQAAHREWDHEVRPGHVETRRKVRFHQPEQIYITNDEQPRRQPHQTRDVALERA